MVCQRFGRVYYNILKLPNKNKNKIHKQLFMHWIFINMLHKNENQNSCIHRIKVILRYLIKEILLDSFLDLTPPISGDLADKFRETVILISVRTFFFSFSSMENLFFSL